MIRNLSLVSSADLFLQHFLAALCDRLLDYDENVRKQVVAVICDVASHALASVPVEAIKLVAERLRDKAVCIITRILCLFVSKACNNYFSGYPS